MTPVRQMIEAAEAVCRRWDSRDWKDAPTADYIAALRTAVQALREVPAEPMFWVRLRSDGLYEGPLHNDSIEETRKRSGARTPLYAAPQPPAREVPQEAVARLLFDARQAMIDYGIAKKRGDHEAIRESTTRAVDALDKLAALAAPPAPAQAVAQWQPIETAPKDGKHILLSDGERVSVGAWASDMDYGADYEGQIGMATWWAVDLGPNNDRPTHWMPLPAAPGATPASAAGDGE